MKKFMLACYVYVIFPLLVITSFFGFMVAVAELLEKLGI